MGMQHPHSGEWVEFEDFGIWGDHVLYNIGDARKRSGTLARRVHRMRFEPDTHLLQGGEVDLVFADGSVRTMTFERLGNQIAFLRCGMYGGPNGGTPDGDLWHGMQVARGDEVVVHGETFDVNDPDVRSRLAGQDQHHCRVALRGRGHLRAGGALRHAVLRGRQGRGHGLLAPRSGHLRRRAQLELAGGRQPLEEHRTHRVVRAAHLAGDPLVAVVDGQGAREGEHFVPRQLVVLHRVPAGPLVACQ